MFELMVALALVIANGFFVASEFALVRLRLTEATEMEGAGRAGARSARHAVEHLDAYLAACQLGITLASIGLGVVGKPAFEALPTAAMSNPHLTSSLSMSIDVNCVCAERRRGRP